MYPLLCLQLETEKGFIMSIFMQVPLVVVKRLQRSASKSADRLRAQQDKEHTGQSDSEDDGEVWIVLLVSAHNHPCVVIRFCMRVCPC